jgi:hypothetical protein
LLVLLLTHTVTVADTEEESKQLLEKHLLTVEDILQIVQGGSMAVAQHGTATGRDHASATALLLYNLAKQAQRGLKPQQEQPVRAAAATLIDDLIRVRHTSPTSQPQPEEGSTPTSFLAQLDAKSLSLSAWSASKLNRLVNVQALCTAVMHHALHSSTLGDGGWVNWSQLLYGLAMSGIHCGTSQDMQRLIDSAVKDLVPSLPEKDEERTPQAISNILYAAGKAGAAAGSLEPYVSAVAAAYTAEAAMVDAIPRDWSNMVWACKALGLYNAAFFATASQAILSRVEQATAQDIANTLYALAGLGWYDPVVYDALLQAMLGQISVAIPQQYSNILYACCIAQHNTPLVHQLAMAAKGNCRTVTWQLQDIANSIMASAALLQANKADLANQTGLLKLHTALLAVASARDPRSYRPEQLRQIYRAHHCTQQLGMPGLDPGSPLLAALQQAWRQHLRHQTPWVVQEQVSNAAAAAGHWKVTAPSIKDGRILVRGELVHRQLGHSLVVYLLDRDKYQRSPLGRLTGFAQLRVAELLSVVNTVVIVYQHDWEALNGRQAAQRQHMAQLLQQAEAAIAARAPGSKAPIVIGLMSQEPPASVLSPPQQDSAVPQQPQLPSCPGTTAVATSPSAPPPPPPSHVLSPEEVEAKMQELKLKQQAAAQKLAAPGPAAHPQPTAAAPAARPQPPALKPPRRPAP